VHTAISLIISGSRFLNIGYGTETPILEMLSRTGLEVMGFDISPKMVKLAKSGVQGTFSESDMVDLQPQGTFAGAFIIFAHLQMSYAVVYKYISTLESCGTFVIGQTPSDTYVKEESVYDETRTYIEDFNILSWDFCA
jgi:2-polyprenyl-3-methyl-5-hydroxy-6-metoxy-1,4-benzoquinol methylase